MLWVCQHHPYIESPLTFWYSCCMQLQDSWVPLHSESRVEVGSSLLLVICMCNSIEKMHNNSYVSCFLYTLATYLHRYVHVSVHVHVHVFSVFATMCICIIGSFSDSMVVLFIQECTMNKTMAKIVISAFFLLPLSLFLSYLYIHRHITYVGNWRHLTHIFSWGQCGIRESVDSICRDGADTPIVHVYWKAFLTRKHSCPKPFWPPSYSIPLLLYPTIPHK